MNVLGFGKQIFDLTDSQLCPFPRVSEQMRPLGRLDSAKSGESQAIRERVIGGGKDGEKVQVVQYDGPFQHCNQGPVRRSQIEKEQCVSRMVDSVPSNSNHQ